MSARMSGFWNSISPHGTSGVTSRIRFGWATRTWPWNVPAEVRLIGTTRPPEHVFEAFRRLHDVEAGAPDSPREETGE